MRVFQNIRHPEMRFIVKETASSGVIVTFEMNGKRVSTEPYISMKVWLQNLGKQIGMYREIKYE